MAKSNENRVKALLKAIGVKQVDFAKTIGIDQTHLSQICNGKRPLTSGMALRIAEAAKCSKEWLESGTGEMFPISQESAFAQARAAGASPFIAAAFQRYCELPPGERKTFERVLRKCVISGIESNDDDAENTAGGGSNTITQTGNNNNASIG